MRDPICLRAARVWAEPYEAASRRTLDRFVSRPCSRWASSMSANETVAQTLVGCLATIVFEGLSETAKQVATA